MERTGFLAPYLSGLRHTDAPHAFMDLAMVYFVLCSPCLFHIYSVHYGTANIRDFITLSNSISETCGVSVVGVYSLLKKSRMDVVPKLIKKP